METLTQKQVFRLLSNQNLSRLKELEEYELQVEVEWGKDVEATLKTKVGDGFGTAICSYIDVKNFNLAIGVNTSVGRAIKAIQNQYSSGLIRHAYTQFPNTWRKAQIDRVLNFAKSIGYKSLFLGNKTT